MTQPQGHSTSGSQERYKTKERLDWEKEFDCIRQLKLWILKNELASEEELQDLENLAKQAAKQALNEAWEDFMKPIRDDINATATLLESAAGESSNAAQLVEIKNELQKTINPVKLDVHKALRKALRYLRNENSSSREEIKTMLKERLVQVEDDYHSHLYSESESSALKIPSIPASYSQDSRMVDGREVLQACFDAAFARDPRLFAIGEDVGQIGDVNQGFAGMQQKYGEIRVSDTGIRETSNHRAGHWCGVARITTDRRSSIPGLFDLRFADLVR